MFPRWKSGPLIGAERHLNCPFHDAWALLHALVPERDLFIPPEGPGPAPELTSSQTFPLTTSYQVSSTMTSQAANSGISQEEYEFYLALLAQQSSSYPIMTSEDNYRWANTPVPETTGMEHLQVPTGFDLYAYGQSMENGLPVSCIS